MQSIKISFQDIAMLKKQIYALADTSEVFQICDSNGVIPANNAGKYELLAGIGLLDYLPESSCDAIDVLSENKHWHFGYFEYPDSVQVNAAHSRFFTPRIVIAVPINQNNYTVINNGISDAEFKKWLGRLELLYNLPEASNIPDFAFEAVTDRNTYIQKVEQIKNDILHGRYYEMNYCIEFKAHFENRPFLPYMLRLNERTSAPFSAFARIGDVSILCSSPERFIIKNGTHLLSQPIKGTNRRLDGLGNQGQLEALKNSEKERAENVMIVDLVRNDLAHVCEAGTIKVDELFGTYPFKTLNHLISSVSGTLKDNADLKDIMSAMFPMGSMTGAPKIEVMKHIKAYEDHQRGIYSGCLGYVSPDGDFDFNVIIRTLVYHHAENTITYKVGSAITFDSEAEHEYEECLLKGHRLEDVFRA